MLMFDMQAAHKGWLRSNLALVLVLVLLFRLGLILVIGLRLPASSEKAGNLVFCFERQLKNSVAPSQFRDALEHPASQGHLARPEDFGLLMRLA
jgi:hypothetical protein